ncbi:MAG: zinc-binding dehydrogenase [Bacteroidota bacterium]
MKKAKAAIFTGSGIPMSLQEIDVPELVKGQVLVRNRYTTLCRSDLNTFSGKRTEKTPTILGHEIVGTIAKLADGSPQTDTAGKELRTDDRITWAIYSSNPKSTLAKRGIPQKAPDLFKYGHEAIRGNKTLHGGLAQFTLLQPNTPILKLNDDIPDSVAALINCSVSTVAGALRLAGPLAGKNVVVSGVGMLGLVACGMAQTAGAKSVTAMDINEHRLKKAKVFGASHFFNPGVDSEESLLRTFGRPNPFDVVLEFSGAASAMENTLKLLSIGGSAIWVGATFPQRDIQLDAEYLIRKLLTIKGLHNYNLEDFKTAVAFVSEHHSTYPFSSLVEHYGTLDKVNEAFKYGIDSNAFRVGIDPAK